MKWAGVTASWLQWLGCSAEPLAPAGLQLHLCEWLLCNSFRPAASLPAAEVITDVLREQVGQASWRHHLMTQS
jgi:hypothetical protein